THSRARPKNATPSTSHRRRDRTVPTLVSSSRGSAAGDRGAAPGSQGAKNERIGHTRVMSNAARRDAPPRTRRRNSVRGHLNLHDHRHDQGTAPRAPTENALQVVAQLLADEADVGALVDRRAGDDL